MNEEIVNPADVAVSDVPGDEGFTPQVILRGGIVEIAGGNGFQGNFDVQFEIERGEDLAHSAFSEELNDAIALGDELAGFEYGPERFAEAEEGRSGFFE